MESISLEALSSVVGGQSPSAKWNEIRSAAKAHCPETVAANPSAPKNRAQAQKIGNACLAEMGSFKAAMGGRKKIEAGIDAAFPE
jgi:hypothetical protein